MPNKAPTAVLTASDSKVQLPDGEVKFDLSNSYDFRNGVIVTYELQVVEGPSDVTWKDKTQTGATAVFKTAGDYKIEGKVTDKKGLFGTSIAEVIVEAAVAVKTIFGASGNTIDSPDTLKMLCPNNNKQYVSRSAIEVDSYSGKGGSNETDKYLDAGCVMFLNLNWQRPTTDSSGNKTGAPFPTNMDEYKKKITPIMEYYSKHPKKENVYLVCENEPTNTDMHNGTMEEYGTELKTFGQLADSFGLKWCDGGVHVGTILGSDLGSGLDNEGSASDAVKLLRIYKTLPTMSAVIIHTSNGRDNTYNSDSTVRAVNAVKEVTGHDSVSNEWHSQFQDNNTACMLSMADGWLKAGVKYNVYISKGGDKNDELNNGSSLTKIGEAYRDFIKGNT